MLQLTPLLTRRQLTAAGVGHRRISAALEAGKLVRLRPGVFIERSVWTSLRSEGRTIARARALIRGSRSTHVFSHVTAAALHGLPLFAEKSHAVHTIVPELRSGALKGVVRHRGPLADDEIVERDGILITSLARTVADVARTSRVDTAVAIADAALRAVEWSSHDDYRLDLADSFRETASTIVTRSAHGVSRALQRIAFADGRAELPGESVSRVHLARLGFAAPRLQVRVPGPDRGDYWVDFALEDVPALGEFDGKAKYLDPAVRGSRSAEDVLYAEKRREDWIRGVTGLRLIRWSMDDISSPDALRRRLGAFGVSPPARRGGFGVDPIP